MDLLSLKKLRYSKEPLKGKQLLKKFCKLLVRDWYYRIILRKYSVPKQTKQNYLSVCAIFKNEALYMQEWLEFHLLMGVNHFYLYNNNSTDNYKSILEPYINTGKVTLIEWPDTPGQLSAYTHFYNNFRNESNWVSFLDLDEFICPRYAVDIPTWLERYKQYPVIMLYWKMFGTSGRLEHDTSKLVIEQYFVCWEKLDTCGKILWNTDYDIEQLYTGMMHSFNVKLKGVSIPPVNIWGKFVEYNIHRTTKAPISIQVNHYFSKSYSVYVEKQKRGDAALTVSPRTYEYFYKHDNKNISSDYTIFRFMIPLKLKLLQKKNDDAK